MYKLVPLGKNNKLNKLPMEKQIFYTDPDPDTEGGDGDGGKGGDPDTEET
jgi:hypothetical protein